MIKHVASISWRNPKIVITFWIIIAVACMPLALRLQSHLEAGGFTNPRGQATQVQKLAAQAFGQAPNNLLIVLTSNTTATKWVIPVEKAIEKLPNTTSAQSYQEHPDWLAKNKKTVLIEVGINTGDTAAQNLVPRANSLVAGALGGNKNVKAVITGAPALNYALNIASQQDAERAELLAFPILLLVLLMVFRSAIATAIPLILAGAYIDIASGIGMLVNKITPLTILYSNAISMIGLAVGIDYSLFIIKRFREELATGVTVKEANQRAMSTAGRSVLFSGLTVVAALGALLIPRVTVFTTIGLGGIIVTAIAIGASTTLLPAVLQVLGERINLGQIAFKLPEFTKLKIKGNYRHPILASLIVLAAFLAGTTPLLGLHLQVPVASANILPASNSARQGLEMVEHNTGARDLFPVQILLKAPKQDAEELLTSVDIASKLAQKSKTVADVMSVSTLTLASTTHAINDNSSTKNATTALVSTPTRVLSRELLVKELNHGLVKNLWNNTGAQIVTQVIVTPKLAPGSVAVHQLVRELRQQLPTVVPKTVAVMVGGQTAQGIDFDNLVGSYLPIVIGFIVLISAILLLIAFRSILLALLALAFNALVSATALGLLTLVEKHLNQQINSVTPLLLLAVMFGLSMDYMVIMATRMKELFKNGSSHREAVVKGTRITAGMVNGAALIMVGVFAAFGTAQISVVQQLGIGLAMAVALDAVVIRRVLMPSTLLIIGKRVWS